jgi:hypothetical protein
MQVWTLYLHAKTWGVRPSSLLNITESYPAYCFDEAVAVFGNTLSAELDSVDGKNAAEIELKRKHILEDALRDPDEAAPVTGRYLDPMNLF